MRAVPSHPMGHFPQHSHRNDIPMDKPVFSYLFGKLQGEFATFSKTKNTSCDCWKTMLAQKFRKLIKIFAKQIVCVHPIALLKDIAMLVSC